MLVCKQTIPAVLANCDDRIKAVAIGTNSIYSSSASDHADVR